MVATAFYRDLESNFDGQVIVMENPDPLAPLNSETLDVRFTKQEELRPLGFFPAPVESTE